VLFYTDECEKCGDLEATLETVACKHRGRINVARVRTFYDSTQIYLFDTVSPVLVSCSLAQSAHTPFSSAILCVLG
jgi:hypothetical protein